MTLTTGGRWVVTADRFPIEADFLTTRGAGTPLVVDTTTSKVYYLDGAMAIVEIAVSVAASSITGGQPITRTNDTNVTLTLGGTPTTALLQPASFTLGWTGQLSAARGGTGVSALGTLTRVNDTNVTLTLGGTPTNSLIQAVSMTLGWSGQLSIARGGTAAANAADARTNLGLGTAAVKNTGTSGDAIPLLNGAATTWTNSISINGAGVQGFVGVISDATIGGVRIEGGVGTNGYLAIYNPAGVRQGYIGFASGSRLVLQNDGSTTGWAVGGDMTISGGLDVTGLLRGDSLRIDAAPVASAAGTTHKLAVNLNGTTYYLLLSNV